ncbi:MAG: hypothetical protein ABSF79_05605 [Smithellaceae bacterium]|jgi:hypothetical protein
MSKVKTGDVLSCEVCGLTVVIDEECGCATAGVICCEEPMLNKGPVAPKKKAHAATAKKKKAITKKAKTAKKKKVAKKKPAKKPPAKKKSTKKRK